MSGLPITSLFAAAAVVALVLLSVPVTLRRMKVGIPIGSGDDEILTRRIRAQGNFIEYVPLGIVALGLAEFSGTAQPVLLAIGAGLAIGRTLHAAGTLSGSTPLRGLGMVLTYLALLGTAGCLVVARIG